MRASYYTKAKLSSHSQRIPVWAALCVGSWAIASLGGFLALLDYSTAPGEPRAESAVDAWPKTTSLVRSQQVRSLVVFLHPRCPCSRASVRELARLDLGNTEATFVFFQPEGAASDWHQTDLWQCSQMFEHSRRVVDRGGAEFSAFGANISGCMMLFDEDGALLFRGGITSGRGHEGNSESKHALAKILKSPISPSEKRFFPVFGCPIQKTNVCSNCKPEEH